VVKLLLLVFLSTSVCFSKQLIISDIDETVKQSNVMDLSEALKRIIFKTAHVYPGMKLIYDELLKRDDSEIFYISASYDFIYDAKEWLDDYGLTFDGAWQRRLFVSKYEYKFNKVNDLINQNYKKGDVIYLFGDNNGTDHVVYDDIAKAHSDKKIEAFVRDVYGVRTILLRNSLESSKVNFVLTSLDLLKPLDLDFLKKDFEKISQRDFLPVYMRKFMKDFFKKSLCPKKSNDTTICQDKVVDYYNEYIYNYFLKKSVSF